MKTEVRIGDLRAIANGLVHASSDEPFEIWLDDWHCVISFPTDDKGTRYVGFVEDDILHIDLYNHKNAFDECIFTPFSIAKRGNEEILMTYNTNTIGDTARRFEYVIWSRMRDGE